MTPDQNNIFEFFLKSDNIRGNNSAPQLSAPATLTPTIISDSEIDLVWTGVINATTYVLQRATQSDYSDATEIYSGSNPSFNDTGLDASTIYYYRVKAHAAGFTDSTWTNASATTDPAQLPAPATLTAEEFGTSEIDLAWDSVVNATNYILQRATLANYSDAVQIYSGANLVFNDTGRTANTTYYYRVKAQAAGFTDSDWTNASATTVAETTSNLTFTTNTELVNTAQVFTATGAGGFGKTGLDVLFLAANQNGRIFTQLVANADTDYIFGINTVNAQTGFAGMELSFDRGSAALALFRFMSNVFYATGVVIPNGRYLALYRVGPMWKAQQSTDGLTWVDIPEYLFGLSFSSAADAYIVCDLNRTATMSFPKITQYSSGNLARNIIQDGDSIALGQLTISSDITTTNIGYQTYAALVATRDFFYKNVSIAGASLVSRNAALAAAVFPLFGQSGNSFDKIIVSLNCGVNDLALQSVATTYANLLIYINNVLNQDPRVCLMVYTVINCNETYVTNAKRLAYNALVLATPQTSRLKIVDVSTQPLLNDATAYQDTTYYQADGIHLKQAGYNLLGALGSAVALTF